MFAWFRQRLRAEEGISLIEMLVSILLMGLVLAALGSTLFATMAAARQNEGTTKATALATQSLENLQALPWDSVGFYSNDGAPAQQTVNGVAYPTVVRTVTAPVP